MAMRKLRMAWPRPVATLGSRLPPNNTRMMANMIVNSQAPIPSISLSYGQALNISTDCLRKIGIESAELDARLLLESALGLSVIDILLNKQSLISAESYILWLACLKRRLCYEPIAYILGHKEFYAYDFLVNQHCLIPRPDTECVVEHALNLIAKDKEQLVFDLCTGSGAIGLSLLKERPLLKLIASDLSAEALSLAEINAKRLGVISRLSLLKGDLFEPYHKQTKADVIVANPPYIGRLEYMGLATSVKDYEPSMALWAGDELGLSFYRRLLSEAPDYLIDGGYLVLEIGFNQDVLVADLVTNVWRSYYIYRDLALNPRCMLLQLR